MNVEDLMLRAISLADPYKYKTKPNPVVGCLILKNDLIISEGAHKEYGSDHAEVDAIKNAKLQIGSLFDSFEDVNYHSEGSHLSYAIDSIKEKDKVVYSGNYVTDEMNGIVLDNLKELELGEYLIEFEVDYEDGNKYNIQKSFVVFSVTVPSVLVIRSVIVPMFAHVPPDGVLGCNLY